MFSIASTPAIYDDKLFISSSDGYLYSLNPENGEEIWVAGNLSSQIYGLPTFTFSSPAVATNEVNDNDDDIVYAVSATGKVFALSTLASKIFLELLPTSDNFGAITFYTDMKYKRNGCPDVNFSLKEGDKEVHFEEIVKLQKIGSEENRRTMINSLDKAKKAQGFTFIKGALEKAERELEKNKYGGKKYIILLSDGSPTHGWKKPPEYKNFAEWTEDLRYKVLRTVNSITNKNISIYTILLNDPSTPLDDESKEKVKSFMSNIAHISYEKTGKGRYFFVERAGDLSTVFSNIFKDVKGYFFRDVPPDNVVPISNFTKRIYFLLLKSEPSETFEINLPEGKKLNELTYRESEGRKYKLLVIDDPSEGEWRIKKKGAQKLLFSIIEGLYINLDIKRPSPGEAFYLRDILPIEAQIRKQKKDIKLSDLEYQIRIKIDNSLYYLPSKRVWGDVGEEGEIKEEFIFPNLSIKEVYKLICHMSSNVRLLWIFLTKLLSVL